MVLGDKMLDSAQTVTVQLEEEVEFVFFKLEPVNKAD